MKQSDFLAKLKKIYFDTLIGDTLVDSENGFELSFSTELNSSKHTILPVQFVLRLSRRGVFVMNWGCETVSDQFEMVGFWLTTKNEILVGDAHKETVLQREAKVVFDAL